jgi:hypothetical protein
MIKVLLCITFFFQYLLYCQQLTPVTDWIKSYKDAEAKPVGAAYYIMGDSNYIYLSGGIARPDRTSYLSLSQFSSEGTRFVIADYETLPNVTDGAGKLALDLNNNIYAAGTTSYVGSKSRPLVAKFNPAGELLWKDNFNNITEQAVAAVDFKLFNKTTPVVLYNSLDTFHDYAAVKCYSAEGDSLWYFKLQDDTSRYLAKYLLSDNSGFVYAVAAQVYNLSQPFTSADFRVLKLSTEGEVIWEKSLGNVNPDNAVMDREDNIIFISQSGSVKKMTPSGDILWTYTDKDTASTYIWYNGVADAENNFIMTGSIIKSSGARDYALTKLTPDGSKIWTASFNSNEDLNDYAQYITADAEDNIYITGKSENNNSQGPCYVVKYSSAGEFLWKYKLQPDNSNETYALAVFTDDSSNVYVGGNNRDAVNNSGYILVKIKQTKSVDVTEHTMVPAETSLEQNYPNPFNPSTLIKYSVAKAGVVTIKVYDILGNEIKTLVNEDKTPGSYNIEFTAQNLASGMYIYNMTTPGYQLNRKMIILK